LTLVYGGPADTTGVLAAVQDTGAQQVIARGIRGPAFPSRITATAGGTAGDIKAIQVIIDGVAPGGEVIQESLPAFTVNTAGTVTGVKVFERVTQITIPAHDGTGATTAVGVAGSPLAADADGIMLALTDDGAEAVVTSGFSQPDVPRNVTATAGGAGGDIKAIQVVVDGTNAEGVAIQETLPAFTVDTPGTVAGTKAFKTVTQVTIPAHDGTGATTAIGFGDVLGIGERLARNTVNRAYLAEVAEATAPTVVADAADLEDNTFDLDSALDGTQVKLELVRTRS
jgi:hypothetical protein